MYFARADIGCPLCVGCKCILWPRVLDSFPLAPEYHGLPLQNMARSWTSGNTLRFLALGGGNTLIRGVYQHVNHDSTRHVRTDTVRVGIAGAEHLSDSLILYGIDSFSVSVTGTWAFRVHGSHGLRSALYAVDSNGILSTGTVSRTADSLTFTASGRNVSGTLDGSVFDPDIAPVHPIKVFEGPVSFVNDSGAVGDGGRFALRVNGSWRTFGIGTGDLRRFRILRIAPNERVGNRGAWGTHVQTWDNEFASTTQFVKDDSTVWADVSRRPILPVVKDSLRVFTAGTDSVALWLYDDDWNHTPPGAWLSRSGGVTDTLAAPWERLRKGCGTNQTYDTLACFPWDSTVALRLSWKHDAVRIRFQVLGGRWQPVMGTNTFLTYYFTDTANYSYTADTIFPWEKGDTLTLRFQNASFRLAHDGDPSSIRSTERGYSGIVVRVSGGSLHWRRTDGSNGGVDWTLRDARGRSLRGGAMDGVEGRIHSGNERGPYWLELRDPESRALLWKGRFMQL